MPRAGFYAIQNSDIRFGRDGRWYADGEPIANARIADLFSRHIEPRPGGGYRLRIGDEEVPIVVDDTPFVVSAVDMGSSGITLTLNDGSRELLDPATLEIGSRDVLYCRVKGGREPARLLRAAYYQLAEHVRSTRAGQFVLRLPTGVHSIGRR